MRFDRIATSMRSCFCTTRRVGLWLTATVLLFGCAHHRPKLHCSVQKVKNFEERTLADPDLKRFIEACLKQRLQSWPPEAWDVQMLTLAGQYFHYQGDYAAAWQTRASVRSNLLHHLSDRHRLKLLNDISRIQLEIIDRGRNQKGRGSPSWKTLSAMHTQYAQTLMSRLETLDRVVQSRVRLAEAVGVPVPALLYVKLTFDLGRGASGELARSDLWRLASKIHPDMSAVDRAVTEYQSAQKRLASLRAQLVMRERERRLIPAWLKDGGETPISLLLSDARLAAARLAAFEAQIQVQQTLGAVEDAARQPAESFGVSSTERQIVSTHD